MRPDELSADLARLFDEAKHLRKVLIVACRFFGGASDGIGGMSRDHRHGGVGEVNLRFADWKKCSALGFVGEKVHRARLIGDRNESWDRRDGRAI